MGLGRSVLATGLLIVPFALGSLLSAANSDRFSTRFGRTVIIVGICAMLAGQGFVLLAPRTGAAIGIAVVGTALFGSLRRTSDGHAWPRRSAASARASAQGDQVVQRPDRRLLAHASVGGRAQGCR
jgi:hypothetical protein